MITGLFKKTLVHGIIESVNLVALAQSFRVDDNQNGSRGLNFLSPRLQENFVENYARQLATIVIPERAEWRQIVAIARGVKTKWWLKHLNLITFQWRTTLK